MPARATDGTCLATLVQLAIPLCRAAQCQCPRAGPSRPPDCDDWKIALLIVVAILKNRKSKSAQYRFLHEHFRKFMRWLKLHQFPVRSTYFRRYRQADTLFQIAIELQGGQAIDSGLADGGYDKNEHGRRVEQGRPGGRHFLCPPGRMLQPNPPSRYRLTRSEQQAR